MKLYATTKNEKGKKEGIGGDSIFIELSYKNTIIGNMGLYTVFTGHGTKAIGYRLVWKDEKTPVMGNILKEEVDYNIKRESKCPECKYNKDEVIIGCSKHYKEAQKGKM